jgi:hypothetical protein
MKSSEQRSSQQATSQNQQGPVAFFFSPDRCTNRSYIAAHSFQYLLGYALLTFQVI